MIGLLVRLEISCMELLKKAILEKGKIIDGNILKVDAIINHQVYPELMEAMGNNIYEHFKNQNITKVVTVESSGIAPLVFMKKTKPSTMMDPLTSEVVSFTKNKKYTLCMEREYISKDDRVLLVDDFLASGEAFKGVETIIEQTGATLVGVGILIEKSFQQGHQYIVDKGYDLYSLADIKSLENGEIKF